MLTAWFLHSLDDAYRHCRLHELINSGSHGFPTKPVQNLGWMWSAFWKCPPLDGWIKVRLAG